MNDARTLTLSLGGVWRGQSGNAPCPVCQPERRRDQDGLSLRNQGGRLLVFCHKQGCSFSEILHATGLPSHAFPRELARQEMTPCSNDAGRHERQAKAIWDAALPIQGTIAEAYLRGRAITCPLPGTLRFEPQGWHPSGRHIPMMVARVDGVSRFAIHRTYISADGAGKAAVEPAKAMLGKCAGGAVRLPEADGPLVVVEGIETGLSLLCGMLRHPSTVLAALSASGMAGLHLPPVPGRLIIAADSDDNGTSKVAAVKLATRADALGWSVWMLPAPQGMDWNDVLVLNARARRAA